jgi:hypothetical protein
MEGHSGTGRLNAHHRVLRGRLPRGVRVLVRFAPPFGRPPFQAPEEVICPRHAPGSLAAPLNSTRRPRALLGTANEGYWFCRLPSRVGAPLVPTVGGTHDSCDARFHREVVEPAR